MQENYYELSHSEDITSPSESLKYLSEFCKLRTDEIDSEELGIIYHDLKTIEESDPETDALKIKYLSHGYTRDPFSRVIGQMFFHHIEALNCYEGDSASYGLIGTSYEYALKEFKKENGNSNHVSLLAGANNPDSVRHFAKSTRKIFPDAQLLLIDKDLKRSFHEAEKNRVTSFPRNLCETGLPSESVDTIQGNLLLSWMSKPEYVDQIEDVVKEFYRILKPNGKLILAEVDFVINDMISANQIRANSQFSGYGFYLESCLETKQFSKLIDCYKFYSGKRVHKRKEEGPKIAILSKAI